MIAVKAFHLEAQRPYVGGGSMQHVQLHKLTALGINLDVFAEGVRIDGNASTSAHY